MSPEETIRATIDKLTEAWNTNDMATFISLFADDANYITGAGVWLKDREAIRDQFSSVTNGEHDEVIITESLIKLIQSDVALVHSVWKTKREQSRQGVITQVMLCDGNTWRIAALHNTDAREEDDSPAN